MLLLSIFLLLVDGVVDAETDETMTVMEGDSDTLHTNLTEVLNDDTILWLFGPKESIISQITRKGDLTSYYVTDDVRFRGRLQVDQKTGSLTIRNTRIRQSGQYKLSISREKTTIKIFNVTVFGVVGETDGVRSVSVMDGDSVTLNTDVEVQRDDLIVWRFGDKGILLAKIYVETNETSLNDADERFRDRLKIDHQTGSLTITNTKTEHTGLYELQIRGRESSQRFLLSVNDLGLSPGVIAGIVVFAVLLVAAVLSSVVIYYRRKISELGVVKKVYVADGDSVTLMTETVLQKDDEIKWLYQHDNDLIAEINKMTPKTYDGLDERFRSKLVLDKTGSLTINNTMPIHSGLYILEISSKPGKTIKRFILTVEMKKVPVKEGHSVTLEIKTEMKRTDDLILWTFGPENCLVVKADSTTSISERFRGRLELDHHTGSLTITNISNTDSGHFKLQIINSEHTTFSRFNVTVTGPIGEHLNNSTTAEMPLLDKEIEIIE
ncbi:uncharacterized protein LOC143735428 isoform X2 [Siphateles boraxobius]|uniref:uncharacterized protein LOC143735428 isoform X2 n=1 Tax=Siphateles boraxobius TaxID=180520 RepID=UPI0040640317